MIQYEEHMLCNQRLNSNIHGLEPPVSSKELDKLLRLRVLFASLEKKRILYACLNAGRI